MAEVQKIDVYFLSRPSSVFTVPSFQTLFTGLYAQNGDNLECVPMGDGCFNPQYGYVENKEKLKEKTLAPKPVKVEMKTINAEEVDLIECDSKNYFDLYCGRAKKNDHGQESDSVNFELWIDTSSSMRLVDYSSEDAYCDRRRLVALLRSDCKKDIEVSIFNTTKKHLGTLDNLCLNHGPNDEDRMVQWLKNSNAKHVVIITDAEEYVGAFREYLDIFGATIHGIGVKPLFASDLNRLKKEFLGFCK